MSPHATIRTAELWQIYRSLLGSPLCRHSRAQHPTAHPDIWKLHSARTDHDASASESTSVHCWCNFIVAVSQWLDWALLIIVQLLSPAHRGGRNSLFDHTNHRPRTNRLVHFIAAPLMNSLNFPPLLLVVSSCPSQGSCIERSKMGTNFCPVLPGSHNG